MKDEIIKKLTAVLGALNSVSVSGRQNLVNLSGSIAVIEEVTSDLSKTGVEITCREDVLKDK